MFPCLVRRPPFVTATSDDWLLFFGGHWGDTLYVAHSDAPDAAPEAWTILDTGVTMARVRALAGTSPSAADHVSSPHVVVDESANELVMWFHCGREASNQTSWYATCDGLDLTSWSMPASAVDTFDDEATSSATYVRPMQLANKTWVAIGSTGVLWVSSSDDGRGGWTRVLDPNWKTPNWTPENMQRHYCQLVIGDTMHVFYTRLNDVPERIMATHLNLRDRYWVQAPGVEIIRALYAWEGADLEPTAHGGGGAGSRVNALRDPHLVHDSGRFWLTYAYAGEYGIGIVDVTDYFSQWADAEGVDLATAEIFTERSPSFRSPLLDMDAQNIQGQSYNLPRYHTHDDLYTKGFSIDATWEGEVQRINT